MKLAVLSQSYPPMISGAAIFVERLAARFSAQDNQVLILTSSDQSEPYTVQHPNLVVKRFRSYRNPARVGQRFALWPHRQVIQSLAEFAPDVIHIHDGLQLGLSSLSFSRPRNIPVIITIHGLPWFIGASLPAGPQVREVVENALWQYARWGLKRCSTIVVGTQTVADVLYERTGVQPKVISCGVDLAAFTPVSSGSIPPSHLRSSLGIPEDAPVILYVGRLDRDKQVDRVIQAAALAMQHAPAHCLIVGDGTERENLEQLCAQLGIRERAHFTGFVPAGDGLPDLYRLATVFVIASEVETQGLVLLEAAASGLPIVAVQATCLHEVVHEGKNGYLLPCGDEAGMAQRILDLIRDPARAKEMGLTGRRLVESHADDATFAAYEELYRTAIQKAGPGAYLQTSNQKSAGID